MVRDKTLHSTEHQKAGPDPKPLSIEFDAAEFVHFLNEADWSDEQKAEYVTLVWNIVCEFVALGWGVHPVQLARKGCGKLADARAESVVSESDVLQFSHGDLSKQFSRLNGGLPSSGGKGLFDE